MPQSEKDGCSENAGTEKQSRQPSPTLSRPNILQDKQTSSTESLDSQFTYWIKRTALMIRSVDMFAVSSTSVCYIQYFGTQQFHFAASQEYPKLALHIWLPHMP
jgi:hypothetical protein